MGQTIAERSKPLTGNGAWAEYCKRKVARSNYTYRIDCTGGYYVVDGQRVEESEFNAMLPIGLINRSNHIRLDSRQELY